MSGRAEDGEGDGLCLFHLTGTVFMCGDSAEFEEARQIGLIEAGEVFVPETRFYDTINKLAVLGSCRVSSNNTALSAHHPHPNIPSSRTIGMRSKEDEVDYRYMPEPDLPPLVLSPDEVGKGVWKTWKTNVCILAG